MPSRPAPSLQAVKAHRFDGHDAPSKPSNHIVLTAQTTRPDTLDAGHRRRPRNPLTLNALQKAVFHPAKDGLSARDLRPFGKRKTAFRVHPQFRLYWHSWQ